VADAPAGTAATTTTDAGDSEYCEVAVGWAIHELQPFDDTDPAAFRAYWAEFEAFEADALAAAPEELEADWQLKIDRENETIDVVLEKYGYDTARMMEEGTPEERAAFEAPPDAAAAQERIHRYESEVCGAGQPQAADVSYDGEEPGPYCELIAAQDEAAAAAQASGDPAKIAAAFDELDAQSAAIIEAAPAVIKDDVADVAAWTAGPQRDVAEAHGYDLAAAMRNGSLQDRFDLNHADEEIRDQFARVLAYEEQVCGA
jgi:hypothetical protein